MSFAIGIYIPVSPEYVLTPTVIYADKLSGIYFETDNDKFGRVTFQGLDSIKVSRGEYLPFGQNITSATDEVVWIYKIINSSWLGERYNYEKKHYGTEYEFGGNVTEMLTDYSHYIFQFHDQFIEVIAKGFWYEVADECLLNKPLQLGHPFLELPKENTSTILVRGLATEVTKTTKSEDEILSDAQLCSQRLIDFSIQIGDKPKVDNTLSVFMRNGEPVSVLKGYFSATPIEFPGIATLEEARPYIEKYMLEIVNRRQNMGLN
ncbi:hypothetical protein [Myroides phaeus]|uniref:hypothetical protein n=1 Tax=Myroides phaeus TaxID=702745 RepID=UPI001303A464|nr:hypothetical protein [Myroides phaeus]